MMMSHNAKHKRIVLCALVGLGSVAVGLSLAVFSNPKRFSLDVANDRLIYGLAFAGFAFTLIGVGLFLYAVRDSSSSMPTRSRDNANAGAGIGISLQFAGFLIPNVMNDAVAIGVALFLAGSVSFIWGTMHYAQGRGYPKNLGLLGLLGVVGLAVLILLPERSSHAA